MNLYRVADLANPVFASNPTHYAYVSDTIREALDAWGSRGSPFLGDFLRAVLSNNLMEACGRADAYNLVTLPAIVSYVYNQLPADCHGSLEKVAAWRASILREEEEARAQEASAEETTGR